MTQLCRAARAAVILPLMLSFSVAAAQAGAATPAAQGASVQATPAARPQTIVQRVRALLAQQDFAGAEKLLADMKPATGDLGEWLEAQSWLGRAALGAKQYDRADRYAKATYAQVLDVLKRRPLDQEPHLPIALGAAIEVQGQVAAATGARSEAVSFLNKEFATWQATSIARRIQKNVNLVSLEGTQAPELDLSEGLAGRPMSFADVKGKVAIVFFWAHWCPDCKQQAPILSALLDKYRAQGLALVAPTQRYGYVAAGKDAGPAEEKTYISQVRDQYYPFLTDAMVQLAAANHTRYGVSTTPTLVVLDRQGIVRSYHPGNMTAAELEALIQKYLPAGSAASR